jgi:hypothetical protein
MSTIRQISTLPDTKRLSGNENNRYNLLSGLFACSKEILFVDTDELDDSDNWYQLMDDGKLTPLHYIKEIDPLTEETIYQESVQDYSYKLRSGKNRDKYKYSWTIDKRDYVELLSGTDLYIIQYDHNNNVYAVQESGGIRGIKTNRIQLEKLLYSDNSVPAFSVLDIEYREEPNLIHELDFNLRDIDRLFMNLQIEYVDSDNINFSATYRGANIDILSASDITVTDNTNGVLTFALFNYLGGVYKLSSFSDSVTGGILQIISDLYLGCANYRYVIQVEVSNNFLFEDGENFVFEDGENFIFEN